MQREMMAGSLGQTEPGDWSARVYGRQKFAGAWKTNSGLLVPLERRLVRVVLPRVPRWLETYHLTLLTPVWSILIVVFGYLAARDLRWLWMANLMIALHYFTDHFDGKLGKFRNTGLRKWGFYLDHLFDYGFLCSILIGYSFLLVGLPYVAGCGTLALALLAYRAQKRLWKSDMQAKAASAAGE